MAKIKLKSYIKSIHGGMGNVIYYNMAENQYARSYSEPQNLRTDFQQQNRAALAHAVNFWQILPSKDKSFYNRMAKGKSYSGYNLFISMSKKGITTGVLKEMKRSLVRDNLLTESLLRADTSVIPTLFLPYGRLRLYRGENLRINQPKELALAS